MKCQRCGAEIGEGKMYCSACGQEIQIVPDFEPEVEHTIDQTMNNILKDVFHKEKKVKKNYFIWIIVLLIFSFAVLLLVFGYMNYTADYQIRRGNYYLKMQDYTNAVKHYEKAEKIAPENAENALYMAECYNALDKIAAYEATLTKVIQNQNATMQQAELAYTKLAQLYLQNNEYQKIHKLLKNCTIVTVMERFGMYCAQTPKFSHEEGTYTDILPLKLQGGEKGTIYYTIDGSDPTTESKQYTSPVFLNKGEYVIKAIYVNEFGVVSDVASSKYSIKF